jgi:hypothetical protein
MTHPEFSGGVSSPKQPTIVVKPHEEVNKAVEGKDELSPIDG